MDESYSDNTGSHVNNILYGDDRTAKANPAFIKRDHYMYEINRDANDSHENISHSYDTGTHSRYQDYDNNFRKTAFYQSLNTDNDCKNKSFYQNKVIENECIESSVNPTPSDLLLKCVDRQEKRFDQNPKFTFTEVDTSSSLNGECSDSTISKPSSDGNNNGLENYHGLSPLSISTNLPPDDTAESSMLAPLSPFVQSDPTCLKSPLVVSFPEHMGEREILKKKELLTKLFHDTMNAGKCCTYTKVLCLLRQNVCLHLDSTTLNLKLCIDCLW